MNFIDRQQEVRATIDQWPVQGSGLNPRVVHCAARAGIETVGQLRTWRSNQLMELQHFGVASLENVRWFFRQTRRIEKGDFGQFTDFAAVARAFLNRDELAVIEKRFALHDPLFRPHMRRPTLQSIANQMGGVTRERVRQIEEEALRNLGSRLCRELLAPVQRQWAAAIDAQGGLITIEELSGWTNNPSLGGYQPCALLRLVAEISDSLHLHFDYFSTLTPKALGRIEAEAIARLQQDEAIHSFAALRDHLQPHVNDPGGQLDHVLKVVLDHHPDICATVDGQYFLASRGTPQVIQQILQAESQPMHFRELAARFNQRMIPNSRRAPGYVLRTLTMMPEVQRAQRALYILAPA